MRRLKVLQSKVTFLVGIAMVLTAPGYAAKGNTKALGVSGCEVAVMGDKTPSAKSRVPRLSSINTLDLALQKLTESAAHPQLTPFASSTNFLEAFLTASFSEKVPFALRRRSERGKEKIRDSFAELGLPLLSHLFDQTIGQHINLSENRVAFEVKNVPFTEAELRGLSNFYSGIAVNEVTAK